MWNPPLYRFVSQGFDPLNLSGMFSLEYMREAELKHGRICQLAAFGYAAVDNGFTALGAPKVSSLEAHDITVKSGHMLLLLFIIAMVEAPSYTAIHEMMSGQSDRKPGDLGIPYKFCKPGDEATMKKYQLAEITHCRAAMMGFSGMVTASAATGAPFPYSEFRTPSLPPHADRACTRRASIRMRALHIPTRLPAVAAPRNGPHLPDGWLTRFCYVCSLHARSWRRLQRRLLDCLYFLLTVGRGSVLAYRRLG